MKLVGYNINPVVPLPETPWVAAGQDMRSGHFRMTKWGVWEGKHGTRSSFFDDHRQAESFAVGDGEVVHLPGERMWDVEIIGPLSGKVVSTASLWAKSYEQAVIRAADVYGTGRRIVSGRLEVRAHGE